MADLPKIDLAQVASKDFPHGSIGSVAIEQSTPASHQSAMRGGEVRRDDCNRFFGQGHPSSLRAGLDNRTIADAGAVTSRLGGGL